MNRARLIPAVIAAAGCLLVLKVMGLTVRGGYTIGWDSETAAKPPLRSEADLPEFGRALARARYQGPAADPEYTGTVERTGANGPKMPRDDGIKEDAIAIQARAMSEQRAKALAERAAAPQPGGSPAERQLLERLQERRDTLEGRNRELEMRESLLKAAEQKLEGRIGDLKEVEGKVFEKERERDKQEQSQVKSLVVMYETMKPKEAARVFDRLDPKVLLQVVTQMNPRKMSEVLAAMSPEAAERLTVALATQGKGMEQKPSGDLPPAELQRIDPRKAPR